MLEDAEHKAGVVLPGSPVAGAGAGAAVAAAASGPALPGGGAEAAGADTADASADGEETADETDDDDDDDEEDEEEEDEEDGGGVSFDYYPYTFSPLLLFAQSSYFDKGFSNYNSVARFFDGVLKPGDPLTGEGGLGVDMLRGVLHERKNMLYDELLALVCKEQMLVTCCIEAHFTAFQVLPGGRTAIYYDPMSAALQFVDEENLEKFAGFLLLKCSYGDSQHMQEHADHYTGDKGTPTRARLYNIWRKINKIESARQLGVRLRPVPLALTRYLLVNGRRDPTAMSTQLTGNTCYFQVYLFALLCRIGEPELASAGSGGGAVSRFLGAGRSSGVVSGIKLREEGRLAQATEAICRFTLEFFVQPPPPPPTTTTMPRAAGGEGGGGEEEEEEEECPAAVATTVLRPLTNSNFVLDFFRHREAPYFAAFTGYLRHVGGGGAGAAAVPVPDYARQYDRVLRYLTDTRLLHRYSRFTLGGAMPSAPNTKSLQPVYGVDDGVFKLGRSNYYKYRACNLMFGFNAGIMRHLGSFCEFNALRKNQLLAFYGELAPLLGGLGQGSGGGGGRMPAGLTKFRDYYFLPQFEAGQRELVALHHYTYLVDMCAMLSSAGGGNGNAAAAAAAAVEEMRALVETVNERVLMKRMLFSTQKRSTYDKMLSAETFSRSRKWASFFNATFMSVEWLREFVGLGFQEVNPREKEVNSLTQTVFYSTELMASQSYRMEHEFEKECINQMARSALRHYSATFDGGTDAGASYRACILIGFGYTYTKYNTLMHFLNVAQVLTSDVSVLYLLTTNSLLTRFPLTALRVCTSPTQRSATGTTPTSTPSRCWARTSARC